MGRYELISFCSALACSVILAPGSRAAEAAASHPADVAYVPAAEIKKQLDGNAAKFLDETLRTVDAGRYNVHVGVTMRALPSPAGSFSHDKVTEVMYVMSGSAVEETGGELVNPTPLDAGPSGPSQRGTDAKGGQVRTVGPGDVSIIPPGVPHRYIKIIEPITFLTIRVDPDRIVTGNRSNANSTDEIIKKYK